MSVLLSMRPARVRRFGSACRLSSTGERSIRNHTTKCCIAPQFFCFSWDVRIYFFVFCLVILVLLFFCRKQQPRAVARGCAACRKSLAEFRARRREKHADHFSRRRVRREKYTPACKCAGCPHLADSSCAQQAAACCRKTPKEFFDSLSSPGRLPGAAQRVEKASQSFAAAVAV